MDITDQMLKLAVAKSVEAGLLPRRALREDFDDARNMMRAILQSALSPVSPPGESVAPNQNARSDVAYSHAASRFVPASLEDSY